MKAPRKPTPACAVTGRLRFGMFLSSLLAVTFTITGCAGPTLLEAVAVLQYGQCQGLEAGVTRVTYEELARIRGTSLLSLSAPQGAQTRDLLLVAISRGQQPTPGYGLTLESASLEHDTAIVRVRWDAPPADARLAQVVTHPCLVVGLPAASLNRVVVIDQGASELGTLQLP